MVQVASIANMCNGCKEEDCFCCDYANREVEEEMREAYKKFNPVKHNPEMFVGRTHSAGKMNHRRKG